MKKKTQTHLKDSQGSFYLPLCLLSFWVDLITCVSLFVCSSFSWHCLHFFFAWIRSRNKSSCGSCCFHRNDFGSECSSLSCYWHGTRVCVFSCQWCHGRPRSCSGSCSRRSLSFSFCYDDYPSAFCSSCGARCLIQRFFIYRASSSLLLVYYRSLFYHSRSWFNLSSFIWIQVFSRTFFLMFYFPVFFFPVLTICMCVSLPSQCTRIASEARRHNPSSPPLSFGWQSRIHLLQQWASSSIRPQTQRFGHSWFLSIPSFHCNSCVQILTSDFSNPVSSGLLSLSSLATVTPFCSLFVSVSLSPPGVQNMMSMMRHLVLLLLFLLCHHCRKTMLIRNPTLLIALIWNQLPFKLLLRSGPLFLSVFEESASFHHDANSLFLYFSLSLQEVVPEVPGPFAAASPGSLCSLFTHQGCILGPSHSLVEFLRIDPQSIQRLPLETLLLDLPPQAYSFSAPPSPCLPPLLSLLSVRLLLPPYETPSSDSAAQPQVSSIVCFFQCILFLVFFAISISTLGPYCSNSGTFLESRSDDGLWASLFFVFHELRLIPWWLLSRFLHVVSFRICCWCESCLWLVATSVIRCIFAAWRCRGSCCECNSSPCDVCIAANQCQCQSSSRFCINRRQRSSSSSTPSSYHAQENPESEWRGGHPTRTNSRRLSPSSAFWFGNSFRWPHQHCFYCPVFWNCSVHWHFCCSCFHVSLQSVVIIVVALGLVRERMTMMRKRNNNPSKNLKVRHFLMKRSLSLLFLRFAALLPRQSIQDPMMMIENRNALNILMHRIHPSLLERRHNLVTPGLAAPPEVLLPPMLLKRVIRILFNVLVICARSGRWA